MWTFYAMVMRIFMETDLDCCFISLVSLVISTVFRYFKIWEMYEL
jgi:hypothetical protein